MTIKDAIKKYVAPKLQNHGFTFKGKEGSVRWVFSRFNNEIEQTITFQKSNYSNALRVEFRTSNSGTRPLLGHKLTERSNCGSFWEFEGDNQLEQVLTELVNLSITHGIPCLELMSIPDIEPTEEMGRKLFSDPANYALEFFNDFQDRLSYDETQFILNEVETIIQERKLVTDNIDSELIIRASAFVGEIVRKAINGRWVWQDNISLCILVDANGVPKVSPLKWLTNFWGKPTMQGYRLVERFESLMG